MASGVTVTLTGIAIAGNGGPSAPPITHGVGADGFYLRGYGACLVWPVDSAWANSSLSNLNAVLTSAATSTWSPSVMTPAVSTSGGYYLFLSSTFYGILKNGNVVPGFIPYPFTPQAGDNMLISGTGYDNTFGGQWGPDWLSPFNPLPVTGIGIGSQAMGGTLGADACVVVQDLVNSVPAVNNYSAHTTSNIAFYRGFVMLSFITNNNYPLNTNPGQSVAFGLAGDITCGIISVVGGCGVTIQAGVEGLFGLGRLQFISTAEFISDTVYRRWATTPYNKQVFFTNELNPVCFTDGSTIYHYANPQPSARYLTTFYDHLILGWPVWNGSPSPTRVQWSDLYKLNSWEPKPTNEADSYDIEEWCRTDFPLRGCTGLGQSNTTLWAFTPTSIISCRYAGRPKVMVFGERVIRDVGNSLMWGLVSYKDKHYFWDGVEQDFYSFDGEQVESIGIKIKGYFLSNVNTSWPLFQATYGYVRPGRQEIVWCFVSNKQTGVVFDKAVVFNWKSSKWYTMSVENIHCFTGPLLTAGRAEDLPSTANTLTGPADQLLTAATMTPPLWGTVNGKVLREEVASDLDGSLLTQDTPTLVTKDFIYGDLEGVKEQSSMILHVNYKGTLRKRGLLGLPGVGVSCAARNNLDDPVVFPAPAIWTNDLEEERLGLPRTAGRILRWQFQPQGAVPRSFTFSGYVDNVYRDKADV